MVSLAIRRVNVTDIFEYQVQVEGLCRATMVYRLGCHCDWHRLRYGTDIRWIGHMLKFGGVNELHRLPNHVCSLEESTREVNYF